ncbi:MAG TPA: ATP-binding cassette domain-containing protein, partial [Stellaceae bacterium]|nr:ATP-binding cassette domain-containing protein [Stellaceae bacterium]
MVGLEHIGKRSDKGAPILSDISLNLEPGGFCFLTGASGAGKTALLRIIQLAELPSDGRLTLFGTDTATLDRQARGGLRRRIGIIFQDLRLVDRLSAGDNLALPLRIAGTPEPQIRDNVRELLAWVGLADRAEAPAATLSDTDRRWIAVARAVARRPELVIADEPAGNADDETAQLLIRAFE